MFAVNMKKLLRLLSYLKIFLSYEFIKKNNGLKKKNEKIFS